MSKEDYKEYWKQVQESEGFDVDRDFAKYTLCGVIIPQPRDECLLNQYTPYAQIALHQYNKENNANFKVVRLEQVNLQGICRHYVLYITFHATDNDVTADAQTKIVQAKLIKDYAGYLCDSGKPEITIVLCRLKSIPNAGTAEASGSANPVGSSSAIGGPDLTYPTDSCRFAGVLV